VWINLRSHFNAQADVEPKATGWEASSLYERVEYCLKCALLQAGYGTRAMELLGRYFEGQLTDLAEIELEDKKAAKKSKSVVEAAAQVKLQPWAFFLISHLIVAI
jgi:hypothetical protein